MTAPRNILITGGARRIGRALGLDLAKAGWNVAIHYHNSESEARDVAKAIEALGRKAVLLKADLSREAEIGKLIPEAGKKLGPLTALINNASVFENDDWKSADRKSWDVHMETNLRAPFALSLAFANALPADADGAIINLTDQRVFKPTPQFLSYSLSKAGLAWLTTTLAQALAPKVRVNAVAPGPTIRNERQSEGDFSRQRAATLLGHGAEPADICAAVRYLLEAKAVTGQTLAADGGQHLIWQTPDVMGRE
jgi:NAD(P)-dependent dehydrogenase (short-subunit alcohol dehydrogenase family)